MHLPGKSRQPAANGIAPTLQANTPPSRHAAFLDTLKQDMKVWAAAAKGAGVPDKVCADVLHLPLQWRKALEATPPQALIIPRGLPLHAMNVIRRAARQHDVRVESANTGGATRPARCEEDLRVDIGRLEFPQSWHQVQGLSAVESLAHNPVAGRWLDLAEEICAHEDLSPERQCVLLTDLCRHLEHTIQRTSRDGRSPQGWHVFSQLSELFDRHPVPIHPAVANACEFILGTQGCEVTKCSALLVAGLMPPDTPETFVFNFSEAPALPVARRTPESKMPPLAEIPKAQPWLELAAPRTPAQEVAARIGKLAAVPLQGREHEVVRLLNEIAQQAIAVDVQLSLYAQLATHLRQVFEDERPEFEGRSEFRSGYKRLDSPDRSWSSVRLASFSVIPLQIEVAGMLSSEFQAAFDGESIAAVNLRSICAGIVAFKAAAYADPTINTVGSPNTLLWDVKPS